MVVLDNCEHLADAAAVLTENPLASCPALTIPATSREALGVEGELNWQVPPLSLPEASPVPTAAALAASDAVKLFEQRAQLVRPSFRVTDDNAAAVAVICQRAAPPRPAPPRLTQSGPPGPRPGPHGGPPGRARSAARCASGSWGRPRCSSAR
jgi:hypothetical protein